MKFEQKWTGYSVTDGKYSDGFSVTVPGNIQRDYAAYMGWGDVNYMDNCRKFLDIEDLFWSYKTEIEYTKNEGERVFFVTHGIEYEYDIILNGKKLVHHEGMFTKVELDITDELESGSALEVLIYPHPKREGAVEDRALPISPASLRLSTAGTGIRGCFCRVCGMKPTLKPEPCPT